MTGWQLKPGRKKKGLKMIFETHAHYDDEIFDPDREELLSERLKGSGIEVIVNVASDASSVDSSDELSRKYPNVYAALGLHPSDIRDLSEEMLIHIEKLAKNNEKVRAVGEIGLDYHYGKDDILEQKKGFVRQIELAKELSLPIIVHSREASRDTMEIIKDHYSDKRDCINGVIHCFSYSSEDAFKYIDLGFVIGVGGVVTYKNGKKLKEVVKEIPLEKIVVETDCPYLAPEPHRGERNTSLNLPFIIQAIAEIKDTSGEEVERITFETAGKLYRIA